jgi:hypothetical protein
MHEPGAVQTHDVTDPQHADTPGPQTMIDGAADRLRATLATLVTHEASLVAEAGGWSAVVPGLPISGSGSTLDDAVDDLLVALREYADDWNDHLSGAPNHRDSWGLVQLVDLSDDAALRVWLSRVTSR